MPLHTSIRLIVCAILLTSFAACEDRPRTTGEKVEDKVKDGLDARPGEKIRDGAEDTKDAVKDAVN